jgi:fructose-1,6-bisphosphatase/inositol monophosphatase family enzyme
VIDVAEVSAIIRSVAATEIMPRFGRLGSADIAVKVHRDPPAVADHTIAQPPRDLVTVADQAAEEALTERLSALLPGSTVVGEEAVARDAAVLDRLAGNDPVWVIDPIDGTHNYAADNARFTTLVALVAGGTIQASWSYAPALDLLATATAGGGAYVDGVRLRVREPGAALRHLDICVPQPHWWTPAQRRAFNRLAAAGVSLCFFDTTGLEYIELAAGRRTAMVVTWEFPWDHAAGLLLHAEAGGAAAGPTGAVFRPAGGNRLPIVVAPDAASAAAVHAALGEVWGG